MERRHVYINGREKNTFKSKYILVFHLDALAIGDSGFDLSVCLFVCKILNIDHNVWIDGDRISQGYSFSHDLSFGSSFPSSPWPWDFTYFWKSLNFATMFERLVLWLSYFTFALLLCCDTGRGGGHHCLIKTSCLKTYVTEKHNVILD